MGIASYAHRGCEASWMRLVERLHGRSVRKERNEDGAGTGDDVA